VTRESECISGNVAFTQITTTVKVFHPTDVENVVTAADVPLEFEFEFLGSSVRLWYKIDGETEWKQIGEQDDPTYREQKSFNEMATAYGAVAELS
jgi:hypothetical protein